MTRVDCLRFMVEGDWVTVLSWLANMDFSIQLHLVFFFFFLRDKKNLKDGSDESIFKNAALHIHVKIIF